MRTLIFHIKLLRSPKITREIEVSENFTVYDLAEAVVNAYDFDFDHAFGFFDKIDEYKIPFDSAKKYELFADMPDVEPTGAQSVKKTKIPSVWEKIGAKMMMLFDYGDDWRFVIELKDFGEAGIKKKVSKILEKRGESPEQYPAYDEE